jgi:hypothetical protein
MDISLLFSICMEHGEVDDVVSNEFDITTSSTTFGMCFGVPPQSMGSIVFVAGHCSSGDRTKMLSSNEKSENLSLILLTSN